MCLVRASSSSRRGTDDLYIRRVPRPSHSTKRIAYYPPPETRKKYSVDGRRSSYVDERPRVQYVVGPPRANIVDASRRREVDVEVTREVPPEVPTPPPPPPPAAPAPVVVEKEAEVEKEVEVEKVVDKKPEKGKEETKKSRLEVISVTHSNPHRSKSKSKSKSKSHHSHSSNGSKSHRSHSSTGSSSRPDIIIERERDIRRYYTDPARRSVPDYHTYRYVEAPPPVVKKQVRYLEDVPRRSTGGIYRERERIVVDNGGRRRWEYVN